MYDEHSVFKIDCHQKDSRCIQINASNKCFHVTLISLIHLNLFLPHFHNSVLYCKIEFCASFIIAILEFWDPIISHKHIFNNNNNISVLIRSYEYSIKPSYQQINSFVILDLWFNDKMSVDDLQRGYQIVLSLVAFEILKHAIWKQADKILMDNKLLW